MRVSAVLGNAAVFHLPKCYIPGKSIFYLNAHISGKNIAKLP
jgi:hypothetical protein